MFFGQERYKVEEFEDRSNFLTVTVNRGGDLTSRIKVLVESNDLSAKSNEDYVSVNQSTSELRNIGITWHSYHNLIFGNSKNTEFSRTAVK